MAPNDYWRERIAPYVGRQAYCVYIPALKGFYAGFHDAFGRSLKWTPEPEVFLHTILIAEQARLQVAHWGRDAFVINLATGEPEQISYARRRRGYGRKS